MKKFKNIVIVSMLIGTLCFISGNHSAFSKYHVNNRQSLLACNGNFVSSAKVNLVNYSTVISNCDPKYNDSFNKMRNILKQKFNIQDSTMNVLWRNSTIYKVGNQNSVSSMEFIVVFNTDIKTSKYGICLFGADSKHENMRLLDCDNKKIILNMA